MKNLPRPIARSWLLTALLISLLALVERVHGETLNVGVEQPSRGAMSILRGQSSTLLPDGRIVLIGGEEDGVPTAAIELYDHRTHAAGASPTSLPTPRTDHSATVLPDGRVLILGGFGADRTIEAAALAFDPATGTLVAITIAGFTPRAGHTATLLTDGRILVAGGIGPDGAVQNDVELINPQIWHAETIDATLDPPRYSHLASLMPASTVLLWGGFDEADRELPTASLYDPALAQFFVVPPLDNQALRAMLNAPGVPLITGGIPPSGAVDFPIDGRVSVRFSRPLDVTSLNAETVVMQGPTGAVAAKVVAAEEGRLVFVTPDQELLPATRYTLFLSGPETADGAALPFSAVSFATEALTTDRPARATTPTTTPSSGTKPASGDAIDVRSGSDTARSAGGAPSDPTSAPQAKPASTEGEEEWIPGPQNFHGDWRAHRQPPVVAKASAPQAADGVTALSGLVLRLNGRPLENVTLSIGGKSSRTDTNGYFLLPDVPPGKQTLTIDGTSANRPDATYGYFESLVEINAGQTNALAFTIWMPKLDTQHTIKIPSPTTEEVVLTTPRIPGFEAHIPAGVVIRDRAGKVVTEIGITPIPLDRTPFPQPWMDFPVYYTVQPGGAFLQGLDGTKVESARLVYPNYTGQPRGQRASFWLYDPIEKGWYVYGEGAVSADGGSVLPDAGVGLYEFTGGGYSFGPTPPPDGPPPCGCGCTPGSDPPPGGPCGGNNPEGGGGDPGANPASDNNGDPVNLRTGLFVHAMRDLMVKDVVPLSVMRVYRPNSSVLGLFGIGTSSPYDMYVWTPDPTNYTSLVLVLANGAQVSYPRVSGTGLTDGLFRHTGSPSMYYYSTIQLIDVGTGHPDYVLKLKDGSQYVFHHHGGKLDSFTDRNGNQTTINRNGESGPITTIVGPTGRTLTFTNNADGTVSQIKDALGRTYAYTYLSQYLQTVTDPEAGVWHYTYDANHRMRTVQDPVGNFRVTNDYDANGRVSKQTYADSSTMQFAYTLDGNGKVTQADVTDQRGNIRRVAFNSLGYVTSGFYPLNQPEQQTTVLTRDSGSGFIQWKTDALNRATAYTYDPRGNLLTVTLLYGTPNAVTTTYTYESTYNQVTSVTDPLGHVWRFLYDAKGNRTATTDPLGNTASMTYNGLGQVTTVTDPLGNATQLSYDGSDLTSTTDALGRTSTTVYDAVGRAVKTVTPMANVTQILLDKLDRVKQVTDPLTGQVNFTYDGNGNLLSYSDQRGNTTSYTYNNLGKRATRTDALAHADSSLYDIAGKFLRVTDRKAQVSGATYDNMNRLTQRGFGATVGNPTAYESTIGYTYDNGNRVTQAADSANGTITRTFDDLDRLTQEQTPQGTVSYTYDAASRRKTMTVAGQPTTNYTYDNANRLTQIQSGVGTVTFTYDAAGRRATTTLANGILLTYAYDNAGQLTSMIYTKGATTIGNLSYTYDADGRRNSVGGTLAQVVLPQSIASALYNVNNQLTQWGGASYAYDLNGNLTSDGSNAYTWNSQDQLTTLSGLATASFTYDAFRRRIGKAVNGTSTTFVYDVHTFVQEISGGAPSANILTGLGLDEPYARAQTSATMSFLPDALGSAISLNDSNGLATTNYSYEPYGATTRSGNVSDNSQQFGGREYDGDGLMFYRARYYSPLHGRFVSEDPLPYAPTGDLYTYATDDPVLRRDPLGLFPFSGPSSNGPSNGCVKEGEPKPPKNPKLPGCKDVHSCAEERSSDLCSCYLCCIQSGCNRNPWQAGQCHASCEFRWAGLSCLE